MKRTISVCDHESDICEHLLYKLGQSHRFVLRAQSDRRLLPSTRCLFDTVNYVAQTLCHDTVAVEQHDGRRACEAAVALRSLQVQLQPPPRDLTAGYSARMRPTETPFARRFGTLGLAKGVAVQLLSLASPNRLHKHPDGNYAAAGRCTRGVREPRWRWRTAIRGAPPMTSFPSNRGALRSKYKSANDSGTGGAESISGRHDKPVRSSAHCF